MTIENKIDTATGLVVLTKKSGETRLLDMDCTNYMRASDTIASISPVTVTSRGLIEGSTDVTVSGSVHDSAQIVQASYAAGTDLEDYIVQATITTTAGDVLTPKALLRVRD